MTPIPSRRLANYAAWHSGVLVNPGGNGGASWWTSAAGWGGAVRTVGCEKLRAPLTLRELSWTREVTQLPLDISALAQSHFGSLKKKGMVWLLLILFCSDMMGSYIQKKKKSVCWEKLLFGRLPLFVLVWHGQWEDPWYNVSTNGFFSWYNWVPQK